MKKTIILLVLVFSLLMMTSAMAECEEVCIPTGFGSGTFCSVPTGQPCTDDGNPCTSDICGATAGVCNHIPIPGASCGGTGICTPGSICDCNDNNLCTTDYYSGTCFNDPITCDDNDPNTFDSCNPATGCVFTEISVGYAHTQSPCSVIGNDGDSFDSYGWVYVESVTEGAGQGAGIRGQAGYGAVDTNPGDDPSAWTWSNDATYEGDEDGLNVGDLMYDEYKATLVLEEGSWDYGWRFSSDGGLTWKYADLGGYECGGEGTNDGWDIPGSLNVSAAPVIELQLTITGFVDGTESLSGNLADGYVLPIEGVASYDHLISFAAGSVSNNNLKSEYFGLYLSGISEDDKVALKAYYDIRGVPEPFLSYLKDAVDGNEPFAYIKGDGTTALVLIDAAKHDLLPQDVPMTIPDDYPIGEYVVSGTVKDVFEQEALMTLKLIIEPVCSPACVHGTCIAVNTCQCEAGWMGDACDVFNPDDYYTKQELSSTLAGLGSDLIGFSGTWVDSTVFDALEWLHTKILDLQDQITNIQLIPGPKGDKGDQGDTGPQGPQGPAGADGAQGEKGETGETGPAGADGATGPQGPTGPQGDVGPAGADGAQGPQGPQGVPGADGLNRADKLLITDGNPLNDFVFGFDEGVELSDPLTGVFELFLTASTQDASDLKDYYTTRGVPEPFLTYLKDAVDGNEPFALIKADGTTDIVLLDAAKYNLIAQEFGMTVPGDYPEGFYTVEGDLNGLADGGKVVLVLEVRHAPGIVGLGMGPKGEVGPQGVPGDKGDKGDAGDTGATGATGPAGAQGEQGLPGVKGDVGETGPAGADGAIGPIGPTGPQGIQGVPGADGLNGIDGAQGPQGDVGPKGDQGEQGIQGIQGVSGEKGDVGETGPAGPIGPQGNQGNQGFSVVSDVTDAGAECLNGGDKISFYRDTNNDGIYQSATDVPLLSIAYSCKGDQGIQGLQGEKGETGLQGEQGMIGAAGADGVPGVDGTNGLNCWDLNGDGIKDVEEDINSDGAWDALDCQGEDGAQGPQGETGPAGADGAQGPQGESGLFDATLKRSDCNTASTKTEKKCNLGKQNFCFLTKYSTRNPGKKSYCDIDGSYDNYWVIKSLNADCEVRCLKYSS